MRYKDIRRVIEQIQPLSDSLSALHRFGLPTRITIDLRMLAFAYFLGVMVGDMSKIVYDGKSRRTMQVLLKLSMQHPSNVRFGNFVALCASLIGIRMKRVTNYSRNYTNRAALLAYRWSSQNSELLMWIFEKCLGLRFGQTTTEHSIGANWLTSVPREFQVAFLQGLDDSDGYVDLDKHEIGIIVEPNQILIRRIFRQLSVHFRIALIKGQATILLSVKEGYSLPIFSPNARTYRFQLARKLSHARRFNGPWPSWFRDEVDKLVLKGARSTNIISTMLSRHNIAVRSQHIRRP